MSRSESRRRRSAFAVRFAPEELDQLQTEATQEGKSLGGLIRERALAGRVVDQGQDDDHPGQDGADQPAREPTTRR